MVTQPTVDAETYLAEDSVDATPKHGTTVQAGWEAAAKLLKPKEKSGAYATDFKFSDQPTLVRFLEDAPFYAYEQHWIDRTEGRRSFVCLGEDCPLCTIAGDKPRAKFAFNILVLSEEEPNVQVLTAPITLGRILQAKHEDTRLGPLTKHYWAISRIGTGRDTQYNVDRVRATDLAEEWELDADEIDGLTATAVKYDKSTVYESPRDELLALARQLVS